MYEIVSVDVAIKQGKERYFMAPVNMLGNFVLPLVFIGIAFLQ